MKVRHFFTIVVSTIILPVSFVQAQKTLAIHEFEHKNVNSITIRGKFCDIYMKKGSTVKFKGEIVGRGDADDYTITSDFEGGDLRVYVDKNNRNWTQNVRARIDITIPAGVELRIDNSSGDIFGSDLSGKEFEIETSSGDVELDGFSGGLEVSTSSGDIELDDIDGELDLESTSGDQSLKGVKGNVISRATSGDCDISDFQGDVEMQTTSGEIRITRGKGKISLKASSGDIEGYGIEITGDAYLRASSGDIDLEFVNDVSKMNFDLRSSSGDLRAGRNRGEKDLYLKNGTGFWVKGSTSSGSQSYTN